MTENNAYQERVVSYEKIHSIDEKDFEVLVDLVNPENGQSILDACCGYGAVSTRLESTIAANGLDTHLVLLDSSELQISRAKEILKEQNLDFVLSDARTTPFEDNHFDTIVNKMGLHEVDREGQKQMLEEFYRIVKPGGKIVIWELALDEQTQHPFSEVIKKKDELSGFDSLIRNRYFPLKEETLALLEEVGFENAAAEHDVHPNLSIRNRKEEFVSADRLRLLQEKGFIDELDEAELEKMAEDKIQKLREFIRENLTDEQKQIMEYRETDKDTILSASKAIFKATKPKS